MRKYVLALAFALILFLIIHSVPLQAQEELPALVKVPQDFASLQQAIVNVREQGTVEVESGIYYEYVRIVKPLTLVATGKVVVDGRYKNYPDSPWQIYVSCVDGIVISGFTFLNTYIGNFGIGIYIENSTNAVVNNCTFEETVSWGIKVVGVSNAIIFNNTIDCFYMPLRMHYSSNISITYNVLRDAGQQFQFYHSRDIVFHHNNVFNDEWTSHPSDDYPRVSNTTCTWDDGKFGNYWSDYKLRYPNATEVKGLGIWDTPYQIDPDDIDGKEHFDYYPLVTDPQPPASHGQGGSISVKWV